MLLVSWLWDKQKIKPFGTMVMSRYNIGSEANLPNLGNTPEQLSALIWNIVSVARRSQLA